MKLVRKVTWEGLKQLYCVEWKLIDVNLPLPRWIDIDLGERVRLTLSYVEEDGQEYWVTRHWYKEKIDDIEEDTRVIINAVRDAAREARRNVAIASQLSGEYLIDVD